MFRSALGSERGIRSRSGVLAVAVACVVNGVGLAVAGPVAAASPAPSSAGSPADGASQCPLDEQGIGAPGTPGLGTLKSTLPGGRVLMTVGSLVGPTGIFAVAVIDDMGIHEIDTTPDWTMN